MLICDWNISLFSKTNWHYLLRLDLDRDIITLVSNNVPFLKILFYIGTFDQTIQIWPWQKIARYLMMKTMDDV